MNTDRMKRDEKGASKYKTVNKLIRNEDMTRAEAKKAVKGMETNVLGPARNTRSQAKVTRSQTLDSYEAIFGPAGRDIKQDPQRHKRYQRWHLPDDLKGRNLIR